MLRTRLAAILAMVSILAIVPALEATPGTPALPAPQMAPDGTPTAPGIPPSQHGWEYDVQVADRLLANGYLSAAAEDYTKILTAYPDHVLGIDRAWLGLAKVHQAQGDTARARSALAEVLRRDRDAGINDEARQCYRALQAEAEVMLSEAQRAVMYYEDRLRQTSWINIFGKLFAYLDVRKARKNYEKVAAESRLFDPRFLIEPVVKPPSSSPSTDPSDGNFVLTPDEMAKLLASTQAGSTGDGAEQGTGGEVVGSTTEEPSGTGGDPGVTVAPGTGGSATGDLETVKDSYLSSYQDLREALVSGDSARIQAATEAYNEAKRAYEELRTASYQSGS